MRRERCGDQIRRAESFNVSFKKKNPASHNLFSWLSHIFILSVKLNQKERERERNEEKNKTKIRATRNSPTAPESLSSGQQEGEILQNKIQQNTRSSGDTVETSRLRTAETHRDKFQ